MALDRRRHIRFALKATVSFLWKETGGVELAGTGSTRDISERGVFVLTNTQAPMGTPVRLEIVFQSVVTRDLHMITEGHVIRVETSFQSQIGGFAVETKGLNIKGLNG